MTILQKFYLNYEECKAVSFPDWLEILKGFILTMRNVKQGIKSVSQNGISVLS